MVQAIRSSDPFTPRRIDAADRDKKTETTQDAPRPPAPVETGGAPQSTARPTEESARVARLRQAGDSGVALRQRETNQNFENLATAQGAAATVARRELVGAPLNPN